MKYCVDHIWSIGKAVRLIFLFCTFWRFVTKFDQQILENNTGFAHNGTTYWHWIYYIWSTGYTTYKALNILHMKHWRGQWGRFYNSGSYFADSPLILMRLSAKNKKRHRFRIQRYLNRLKHHGWWGQLIGSVELRPARLGAKVVQSRGDPCPKRKLSCHHSQRPPLSTFSRLLRLHIRRSDLKKISLSSGRNPTTLRAETTSWSILASSTERENGKLVEIVTKHELYTQLILPN